MPGAPRPHSTAVRLAPSALSPEPALARRPPARILCPLRLPHPPDRPPSLLPPLRSLPLPTVYTSHTTQTVPPTTCVRSGHRPPATPGASQRAERRAGAWTFVGLLLPGPRRLTLKLSPAAAPGLLAFPQTTLPPAHRPTSHCRPTWHPTMPHPRGFLPQRSSHGPTACRPPHPARLPAERRALPPAARAPRTPLTLPPDPPPDVSLHCTYRHLQEQRVSDTVSYEAQKDFTQH